MYYEMLVGLNVLDDHQYQDYRIAMKPILSAFGGSFGYDFKVSEVLMPTQSEINRVFTLQFCDEKTKDDFFTDTEYLKVKAQYFDGSVGKIKILSSYNVES